MPNRTVPAAAEGLPTASTIRPDHPIVRERFLPNGSQILHADDSEVYPFLRAAHAPSADEPRRPQRPHSQAIEDLADVRAMLGLLCLAAESLPHGHAREFAAVLEPAHRRITAVLAEMSGSALSETP